MEKVLLNFSLILIVIYFYKITRHGLHILQLENYYLDRYVAWMKKNIKKVFNIKKTVLLIIPIILLLIKNEIVNWVGFGIEILVLLILILFTKKNKEKKPFVVTARIKRVYFTYFILFVIMFVLANVFDGKISLVVINICAILAYIFVYIVNLINRPVEKGISRGFCKKA